MSPKPSPTLKELMASWMRPSSNSKNSLDLGHFVRPSRPPKYLRCVRVNAAVRQEGERCPVWVGGAGGRSEEGQQRKGGRQPGLDLRAYGSWALPHRT
eukprot:6527626-Prymnesium_polylepis.1